MRLVGGRGWRLEGLEGIIELKGCEWQAVSSLVKVLLCFFFFFLPEGKLEK